MIFNGIKTNIETREQYEKLLYQMVKFFMRIEYPDYKITKMEIERVQKNDENTSKRLCAYQC